MTTVPALRSEFAADVALHAPDWTIGDRTYAAADVFAAVDPDGYAVALADFAAEREALLDDR